MTRTKKILIAVIIAIGLSTPKDINHEQGNNSEPFGKVSVDYEEVEVIYYPPQGGE